VRFLVGSTPAIIGHLGDAELSYQVSNRHPHINLLQRSHDLLRRIALLLHGLPPFRKSAGKLTHFPDHFHQITSMDKKCPYQGDPLGEGSIENGLGET
jgi:hypothetical protein